MVCASLDSRNSQDLQNLFHLMAKTMAGILNAEAAPGKQRQIWRVQLKAIDPLLKMPEV